MNIQTGIDYAARSVHISRPFMLDDLKKVFDIVPMDASKEEYKNQIIIENCLGKRSLETRTTTYKKLSSLYSFDKSILLFRGLRYYWRRDIESQPLLALVCSCARDALLRDSVDYIMKSQIGSLLSKEDLEPLLLSRKASKSSITTAASHILTTWTRTGHVAGGAIKHRASCSPTPCAAAFAAFVGYLSGERGHSLFETIYTRILDVPSQKVMDLVEMAASQGLLVYRRIGNVVDIQFPNLLTDEEVRMLHEYT